MGLDGIGFGRLLQVSGALIRTQENDRLRLPVNRLSRERWNRDELGLFRWGGSLRRSAAGMGSGHGPERASSRSAA